MKPKGGETLNVKGIIDRLKKEPTSFIIDMTDLNLEKQQQIVAEYCDDLLMAKLGKGIMTIFEECQDFVPQQGKPVSFDGIVRLCKLGRQNGYGVCLISQRPASVSKEALSQCSVYMIHNLINHRDLKAVEDQMGFGTDKSEVKKVLGGISAAQQGEVVCYSPSYFRDEGFFRASKILDDRKVNHTGNNIEMKPATYASETNFSPEPSRTLSPISEWKQGESDFSIGKESFNAMPELPQTSLSGLGSADVQNDFPDLEYVSPADRHTIDITEEVKETEEPKSRYSNPLVGIAGILAITGVVVLGLNTLSS